MQVRVRALRACLVSAGLSACVEAVPPSANSGNDPNSPGDSLTAEGVAWEGNSQGTPSLVFSADGLEVFAVTAPATSAAGVSAIHTGTRLMRSLATMTCCPHSLLLSPDGTTLFFAVSTISPTNIDRISVAGTNRATVTRAPSLYALSADGRFFAATVPGFPSSNDSLIRIDLSSGTRLAVRAPGAPIALAPDGSEAITSRIEASIVRHERFGFDGVARGLINEFSLNNFSSPGASIVQIQWTDSARILLFERAVAALQGVFLRRTLPATTLQPIVTVPLDFQSFGNATAAPPHAWMRNGSRIAIWINSQCLEGVVPSCLRARYQLHLVTPGAALTRVIAQIDGTRVPSATTFSRDGSKVAYVASGRVFLVSVP